MSRIRVIMSDAAHFFRDAAQELERSNLNDDRPNPVRPPVRLRRSLLGYRVGDVVSALDSLEAQVAGLARSTDRLYLERRVLQTKLDSASDHLRDALAEQAERFERMTEERRATEIAHADRHLAEARAQAAELLADASEQAATLRHQAGLRVGDAASRLEDLLRVREQVLGELRGLVGSYADLLGEYEGGKLEASARPGEQSSPDSAAPSISVAPPAGSTGLSPRHVELDAGPFVDFAELSAFERALARLPKVDDVYIRSFGDERAVIELSLTEQTPLAHDLATKLPYGVRVERGEDERLLVEVLPEAVND